MRRVAILTAGAALVLGSLAIPGLAVATGRTTSPQQSTTISAQSTSLDNPVEALGKRGHGGKGWHKGHGRSRHGYHRHGYHRGGSCYGCWGPGSRCTRYGCGFAFLYPGYGGYGYGGYGYGYGGYLGAPWWGGFGCNFDYPCGPPFDEKCRSFRGAPSPDPRCQAEAQPAPGANTQPAPAQPAPDQGAAPAPAPAPAPDQGVAPVPQPGQGEQPRPY